jgi:regulator of RNase E activity RraA
LTNLGFRILKSESNLDRKIIEKFRDIVTPHISNNMNRLSAINSTLRPYHKEGTLVGTAALTVKTRPGNNLTVHKAIDLAKQGMYL